VVYAAHSPLVAAPPSRPHTNQPNPSPAGRKGSPFCVMFFRLPPQLCRFSRTGIRKKSGNSMFPPTPKAFPPFCSPRRKSPPSTGVIQNGARESNPGAPHTVWPEKCYIWAFFPPLARGKVSRRPPFPPAGPPKKKRNLLFFFFLAWAPPPPPLSPPSGRAPLTLAVFFFKKSKTGGNTNNGGFSLSLFPSNPLEPPRFFWPRVYSEKEKERNWWAFFFFFPAQGCFCGRERIQIPRPPPKTTP